MTDILQQATSVLRERFGLAEFRPKQREVIERILNGQSTMALLPTGYGKSICYQVPSQILPYVTIVVSPLIALMQDQLAGLLRRGIRNATVLNSSVSFDQIKERVAGIRRGEYKLVYVAPERFESSYFRSILEEIDISLLVIDEAHCISQWGHDFRPQYRNLRENTKHLQVSTILAVTATATQTVRDDIQKSLSLPPEGIIECSFDRPNLHFEVKEADSTDDKDDLLCALLDQARGETSIVYSSTRKDAERVADVLKKRKFAAACYHAGMSPDARVRVQKQFEAEKVQVIVCTVAFGMGVDKSNIRRVIHYNLPGSLENYYQEAGRAGRDGEPATCTLLYQGRDIRTQKFFIEKNYPKDAEVQKIWDYVRKNSGSGIREVLSETRVDESAFNSAIDFLKQTNRVTTGPNGTLLDGNPSVRIPAPLDTGLLARRRKAEENRLQWMINYAQGLECRRKVILDYFGQRLTEPCSGCDTCDGRNNPEAEMAKVAARSRQLAGELPEGHEPGNHKFPTDEKLRHVHKRILDLVVALRMNVGRSTAAQILTGSRNKRFKEKGYTELEEYGSLTGKTQDSILEHVDALISEDSLKVTKGMYPVLTLTSRGRQYYSALRGGREA